MTTIKIYGYRGVRTVKPFQVNTVDDDPDPEINISEEEPIFNYSASETEQTDENQGSAPDE